MATYLAFDYRSTKELLGCQNDEYFSLDFPLFYLNEKKESAIDVALENNLLQSVTLMINYIVSH